MNKTTLKRKTEHCFIPLQALSLQANKRIPAVCHCVFNDIFTIADNIIFTGSKYELVFN